MRYNVVDITPVLTCRAAEWPQHVTAKDSCVMSTCFRLAFINNHTIKHRHQSDPRVEDPVSSSSSSGSTLSSLNTRLNQTVRETSANWLLWMTVNLSDTQEKQPYSSFTIYGRHDSDLRKLTWRRATT